MYNSDILFFNTQTASNSGVQVYYGGNRIADIVGPEPFIDISKTYQSNSNNLVETATTTIELTGKIVKTNTSSPSGPNNVSGVIQSIKSLEDLFRNCNYGHFEIKCDSSSLYSVSGVKVTSFNVSKSDNNWTQTADYTIGLEYITSIGPITNVTDKSETWNIEQQDDTFYTIHNTSGAGNSESFGNYNPGTVSPAVNGPNMGVSSSTTLVLPQYRISRKLSAKGIPTPSGTGCLSGTVATDNSNQTYLHAKAWVESQLNIPFSGQNGAGSPYFSGSSSGGGNTSNSVNSLYNHVRTISTDIYNGTYEVNDTWLALPDNIGYIETYNIEKSTSAEFITTVRVAGNLQGLHKSNMSSINNSNSGIFPSGSGLNNQINLDHTKINASTDSSDIPASHTGPANNRYESALSGWLQKIKPILYRRASWSLNTNDRNGSYSTPTNYPNTINPPDNPVYKGERYLNNLPVSTSEGHDPIKGIITYSYEFTNKPQLVDGVLSETINITNDAPADSISETQVLGRYLGPIIQSNGKTSARKSISIDLVLVAPTSIQAYNQQDSSCPVHWNNYIWKRVDEIIQGNRPFHASNGSVYVQSDQETWNPSQGRYTRNVNWAYQQCNASRFYLDH